MPASFSCQRTASQSTVTNQDVSASSGAQDQPGAKPAIQIKNPATSAGQIRLSFGSLFPRGLRRMNSKLDFFYPVLVTNLTSSSEGRPGIRTAPNAHGAPPTSGEYSNISDFVKWFPIISLKYFVDIPSFCANGGNHVEIGVLRRNAADAFDCNGHIPMPYFALIYELADDYIRKRGPLRHNIWLLPRQHTRAENSCSAVLSRSQSTRP
jgi:hypothetical protein